LDSNYSTANKVFWQTTHRLSNSYSSIKDPSVNILSDENEILSRWREYFDFLNPVKATNDDTYELTDLFRRRESLHRK